MSIIDFSKLAIGDKFYGIEDVRDKISFAGVQEFEIIGFEDPIYTIEKVKTKTALIKNVKTNKNTKLIFSSLNLDNIFSICTEEDTVFVDNFYCTRDIDDANMVAKECSRFLIDKADEEMKEQKSRLKELRKQLKDIDI